jgi:ribosomal 30S subunit maturation factor RimM
MATVAVRDFVGLPAFSRDGSKLGKVKDVIQGGESAEYLVVGGFFSRGLVVPADIVKAEGESIVIPFTSSYLDMAPSIDAKKPVSAADRDRLRSYYHTRES